MKTSRWFAAGAAALLLSTLVFWQTSSPPRPQAPVAAAPDAAPASVPAVTPGVSSATKPAAIPTASSQPAQKVATASAISAFDDWAQQFIKADVALRPALLAKAEPLANARREEMIKLIRENPEQAIAQALPYSVRKQLPESILSQIEQPLSTRGSMHPHINYLAAEQHPADCRVDGLEIEVRQDKKKKTYRAYTWGKRLHQPPHDSMFLSGITAGNVAAIPEDAARGVTDKVEMADLAAAGKLNATCQACSRPVAAESASVLQFGEQYYTYCGTKEANEFNAQLTAANGLIWEAGGAGGGAVAGNPPDQLPPAANSRTQGIKKLLYIRVTYADQPQIPQSEDAAYATAAANNRFFNTGSYNSVWWETTVTPVIRLPQSKVYYGDDGNLIGDALAGAAALGYFSSDYYMYYVLTTSMPQFLFGGISSGILNNSPGALTHELGHNFGLPHANFYQPEGRNPGPTNNTPFPTDPDSILIGHNDINAPVGRGGAPKFLGDPTAEAVYEYGHPYDTMGGGGQFNTMFKYSLNWLPRGAIATALKSTTNRIYAFDVPRIQNDRTYALVTLKRQNTEYWLSYRQGVANNPWFASGLEIMLNTSTVLIDTTPDSAYGRQDAALVVGRTFHDSQANLHITPIAISDSPDPTNKWIDVVLQIGNFLDNHVPTLSISADVLTITNGGTVTFSSIAQDSDGDQLAYYWEFGDHSFGTNGPTQSRTYPNSGVYVARCEVSDMKGGTASRHVVVTVGTPTTYTVSGRILDSFGNGVQGVRVHNSRARPDDGDNPIDLGTYRYGFTDSDGYYVIGNVPPGSYTERGFLYGYRTVPQNFTDPLVVTDGNTTDFDFLATPITRVRIAQTIDAHEPGEDGVSSDEEGHFVVTRDGDLSEDLVVRFEPIGQLNEGNFFSDFATIIFDQRRFIIPAGFSSVDFRYTPTDNGVGTGNDSVGIRLLLATNDLRVFTVLTNVLTTNGSVISTNTLFVTRTNNLAIPGWELRPSGPSQALTWFQTDPTYVLGLAESSIQIIDDDPPAVPLVGVAVLDSDVMESSSDTAAIFFFRSGAPITNDLTIAYGLSGIASNNLDYTGLSGSVTIPAGEYFIIVYATAVNDLFVEGNEQATVTILPDPQDRYTISGGSANFLVVDDDLPLVNIFAADSSAVRGGGNGRVTFSRAGTLSDDLTVNYLVTGTALPGVDYTTLAGSVTIPAGQISIDVSISAIASASTPLPRTVIVQISDSTTYNIYSDNAAIVTLIDGTLPTVTISGGADIGESGGSTSFTVTRTGPTTNSLNVVFEVGGTAWEGIDYTAIGTNVIIPVGAASANITLSGINDNARERGRVLGAENIVIQLLARTNYLLGSTTSRSIRVNDDEGDTALPAVGFLLGTSTIREDAGTALIYVRVTANPATNRPVEVDYRILGGTAIPGVNYVPGSFERGATGVLHFIHVKDPDPAPIISNAEGSIEVIQVPILNDGVSTANRTLTLTLMNPGGYVTNISFATNNGVPIMSTVITRVPTNAFLGPSLSHTLTILDVGTSTVTITPSSDIAYELGAQPVRFTVTRSGTTNAPLTIAFAVNGTAASGNDFTLSTNGSITIPAGTNSAVLTLIPRDDPTEEMAEFMTVSLLPRPGYAVGSPSSATVVLVSDDGAIQFLLENYDVPENAGVASIPVVRSGNTNLTVSVSFVVSNRTAIAGSDYVLTNGTITFAPGETLKTFDVPLIDDAVVEPDETVAMALFNPSGGIPLGGQKTATLTIVNDDTDLAFRQLTFRGNENSLTGQVEIVRSGVITNAQSVTFTATNGSAGSNDFVATNLVLNFAPGQTNAFVSIDIFDDNLFEGDETVSLRLTSPLGGASLGAISNASLVIVDDECRIEFESTNNFVREYSNSVTIIVRRTGGTVNPVSATYTTADGTAIDGLDYLGGAFTVQFTGDHFELDTNGTGQLTFVAGESEKLVTLPIVDDADGEGNEDFIVTLSNPETSAVAAPNSVLLGANITTTVTIIDNETAGNVDYEFVSGPNAPVRAAALQYDNKIVIAGEFTQVDGFTFIRVARLQANGIFDSGFNPGAGANNTVYSLASAPDGKVYLGGDFTQVNNTNRTRIARLAADGKLDLVFSNSVNDIVRAIALQTNGQVIIAGDFTSVGGTPRSHIARLNVNGSLDAGFNPSFSGNVNALAIQSDGRILAGGAFATVNGTNRASLARLNTSGGLDLSFATGTGFNGPVNAIAVQPDGLILAGGQFSNFDGNGRNALVRLTSSGAVDANFGIGSGASGAIQAIAVGPNSKIVIAGDFTTYNGALANRFARLKKTGGIDFGFVTGNGANASVRTALVQPDSAVIIGGDFTEVNGIARNYVARIHGDEKAVTTAVEFASVNFLVPENAGSLAVTVLRSGNTNTAFSLSLSTYDITATNALDYVGVTNTISFAAGETSAIVNITILNDTAVEGDENFGLFLSGAPALVDLSGNTNALVTIQDDEKGIQFARTNYVVSEGVTNAVITLQRVGGLSGTISATLVTADLTALAGSDYISVSTNVAFAPGQTNAEVFVPIIDDPTGEPNETLSLSLINPVDCAIGTPGVAPLSIVDNDFTVGTIIRSNTAMINIFDAQPASPYPSTIVVNNLTGLLSHVEVQLVGLRHSFPADIDALLVGPAGEKVLLMSDVGGSFPVTNLTLTFDDTAPGISSNAVLTTSTNRPTDFGPADNFFSPAPVGPYGNLLSIFGGKSVNGTWSLYVLDDRGNDAGVISNGWRLIFSTVDPAKVADLSVTGSVSPASGAAAGDVLLYSFIVSNAGPNAAANVLFSNALPAGVTIVGAFPSQGSCVVSNGYVLCALDFLTSNSVATVDFKTVAGVGGTLTNAATVSSQEPDSIIANNTVSVVTTIAPGTTADLSVTLTDAPDPAFAGQPVTYHFVVTNRGPLVATGVLVTNYLPLNGTFVSASISGGSFINLGDRLVFTVGTMPANSSVNGNVIVQGRFESVMTNIITASANEPDLTPENTAVQTTVVTAASDLSVTTSESRDPAGVNVNVTYTITVFNDGPSVAHNVTLFDSLPPQFTLVSFSGSQGTNYATGGTLVFEFGTITNGAFAQALIVFRTTVGGTFTNLATAVAVEPEPSPANNTSIETTTVSVDAGGSSVSGIIDNGIVQLGVHRAGHLNVPGGKPSLSGTTAVGLRYLPTGAESTAPGCLCEGWGAADAISRVSGGANESSDGGPFGLVVESFTSDGVNARSVVRVIGGTRFGGTNTTPRPTFRVTHFYHPSPVTRNLYQVDVTIENISTNVTEVLYRRVMDWDIEPTPFREYSTVIKGDSTNLVFTSDNGFASADPLIPGFFILATNTFVDSGPADHGALFDFNFGLLNPGQSTSFVTYYGAAGTERDALSAVARVGAEAYSFGKSSFGEPETFEGKTNGSPNTFIFGFGGIGGTALAGADLRLSIATPSPFAGVGSIFSYTIVVTNAGPDVATNVVLLDTPPSVNANLLSYTTSRGTIVLSNGVLTADIGTLFAGGFATILINVIPTQEGSLTNGAVVSTDQIDFNLDNNVATNIAAAVSAGTYANPSPVTLLDAGTAATYPSIIRITNAPNALTDLTVTLSDLRHTYPADLDILVVGPSGQNVMLMSDAGGGFDLDGVTLLFTESAASGLPPNAQIVSGSYKPTNIGAGDTFFPPAPAGPYGTSLSIFNGTDPNGDWKLFIMDDQGSDAGVLAGGWRMNFIAGSSVTLFATRSGNDIVFSWPASAVGYFVVSGPEANGPWSPLPGTPQLVNGVYTQTVPVTGQRQFFRLKKP